MKRRILCFLLIACLFCLPGFAAVGDSEQPAALSVVYGDVNGDGDVNASDALLALQHSVKLLTLDGAQAQAADVNADREINAADALLILQYSVKLIDRFPADTEPGEEPGEDPAEDTLQPGLFKGIDVSQFQGDIDWNAVKADGIDFAMIRTGYGREEPNQKDQKVAANIAGAQAAGLPYGFYHYSYANSPAAAVEEASFIIKIIGQSTPEYPVVLGMGDASVRVLGKTAVTAIARAYVDAMKEAGYYPMIYANSDFVQDCLDLTQLEDVDIWLAAWQVEKPNVSYAFTMWQSSSSGSVKGIQGSVDTDVCYVDYPTYIKAKGFNLPKEPTEPVVTDLQPGFFKGIDVSEHQGVIDWNAVKADGYDFAMIRTGYGREAPNQVDKYFAANVKGARDAGLHIGAYHYSYADSAQDALNEVNFMLKILGDTPFDYPIVLDLEDPSQQKLGKQVLTDIAVTFMSALREAGYYPMLYSNLNWANNLLDMSRLKDYDLWLALWQNSTPTYNSYTMWQYTSDGSVKGINGRVDMDYCYVDYASYIKANGLNGYSK